MSSASPTDSTTEIVEVPGEAGRRATNVELFLDLVFVFVVTQVAEQLGEHVTAGGVLRSLLVGWLVWWLWTQYVWMGTAVNLESNRRAQLTVVAAIAPTLVMAAAIPTTSEGRAVPFGVAYLVSQLVAMGLLGWFMRHTPDNRRTFTSYAGAAQVGPVLVLVGSFLETPARWWVWAAALAAGIVGAFRTGRRSAAAGWTIDPAHFSERHGLFVIIALGEVLVGVGVAAADQHLRAQAIGALLACVAGAGALWWVYFAFVPRVTEHALARVTGPARTRVARDICSFMHFPLVFGVICFAVAAHAVMEAPGEPLDTGHLVLMALSGLLYIGAMMAVHWYYNRGLAIERPVAAVAIVLVSGVLGPHLAAGWLVVLGALTLVVMHSITVTLMPRRLAAGEARVRARSADAG